MKTKTLQQSIFVAECYEPPKGIDLEREVFNPALAWLRNMFEPEDRVRIVTMPRNIDIDGQSRSLVTVTLVR